MPQFEKRRVKFAIDQVDEAKNTFTGYASVFENIDDGGDIMDPAAFDRTLKENFDRIKIMAQHGETEPWPIGKPLKLDVDQSGLWVEGRISETEKGKDALILLRDGVLNEMSIGYDAISYVCDQGITRLTDVELWEISLVTWAMNPEALVHGVKSRNGNKDAAEFDTKSPNRVGSIRAFLGECSDAEVRRIERVVKQDAQRRAMNRKEKRVKARAALQQYQKNYRKGDKQK